MWFPTKRAKEQRARIATIKNRKTDKKKKKVERERKKERNRGTRRAMTPTPLSQQKNPLQSEGLGIQVFAKA